MLGRQELVNKLVASKSGIAEQEVARVMDFCYKELETELTNCNYPFIYVRGLGTFAVKLKAVNARLYRLVYMRCKRRKFRSTPAAVKALKTMTDEIFKLFSVRRLVRNAYRVKDSINNKR